MDSEAIRLISEELQQLIDDSDEEFNITAPKLDIELGYGECKRSLANAVKSTRSLKTLNVFFLCLVPVRGLLEALIENQSVHTFIAVLDDETFDGWLSRSGIQFGELVKNNKTIKSLKIQNTFHLQRSYEEFSNGLSVNQSLTSLSLSECNVTDDALKVLVGALKNNTVLKSLDLSNNTFGTEGLKHLGALLKENTILENLILSGKKVKIESDGWKEFFGGLKMNSSLTELNLNMIGIKDATTCAYINDMLKHNTTLEQLQIGGNGFGSAGLNSLLKFYDNTSFYLTSLSLVNTGLDSNGCQMLANSLSVNDKLTELDLSFNNITADGCKWIGTMLKHNKTLTELRMSFNKIGSGGAQWLAEGLKSNARLIRFELNECGITSEGCTHIARALVGNLSLMSLNLNGNDIGADGCAALVRVMQGNQSVTQLFITKGRTISETSLNQLAGAQKRNEIMQRMFLSHVMTTLITMARSTDDIVSLLPMEIWMHIFKQCVCGGVPGFDQIALDLFSNRVDCRDISSLVKMKIVRTRGKSILALPRGQYDDEP